MLALVVMALAGSASAPGDDFSVESTATVATFAALRGEECVGVLVGAQTARRSAAVTVASAPDELVEQAAQGGLLHGPREGACYYVLNIPYDLRSMAASSDVMMRTARDAAV
jgi:hypothetical protein